MVEVCCWLLSEGFSGMRPSWCQQVSKMENQMLNLLLLPLPQAALGVAAGEVPFVQLKWPACAPPASMVRAVWGLACARGLVGSKMSP